MKQAAINFSAIVVALAAAVLTSAPMRAADRTNIILIMADDIGYECYGTYGGTSYPTPNIDRLAANGIRFNHCYSQPLCTPSRVKIMTGKSNVRNYAAFSILKKSERTFAHLMRDAGYRTAVAGKWQLYGAEHYKQEFRAQGVLPEDAGFERHCLWQVDKLGNRYWEPSVTIDGELKKFGPDVYGPDVYCQFLLDRMTEYRDEPFFLYYPMVLVHSPFLPTPDSADRNSKDKQHNFGDMVTYMDKLIGRIVNRTAELGIADRTLVLVTGDNGTHKSLTSMMGDLAVQGGKGSPTDAGTRVALVGYQPGRTPKGVVSDRLVEFSDFLPTIAEASGVSIPTAHDGVSFLAELHGTEAEPREPIFIYYWPRPERGQPTRFARDQRWKLYGDGRLIDVQHDVFEKVPVVGHDEIRTKLQRVLDRMPAEGQTLLRYE
ncbi:MAG: sulfatase-like hydrolase/transferase [Fuerstiella sp.]